jgi:hypothetical protein
MSKLTIGPQNANSSQIQNTRTASNGQWFQNLLFGVLISTSTAFLAPPLLVSGTRQSYRQKIGVIFIARVMRKSTAGSTIAFPLVVRDTGQFLWPHHRFLITETFIYIEFFTCRGFWIQSTALINISPHYRHQYQGRNLFSLQYLRCYYHYHELTRVPYRSELDIETALHFFVVCLHFCINFVMWPQFFGNKFRKFEKSAVCAK